MAAPLRAGDAGPTRRSRAAGRTTEPEHPLAGRPILPAAAAEPAALAAAARSGARLVCSDDDPYCPEGGQALFGAPLELDVDLIPGGGHLSEADGYGPWPSMTAWGFDASVRLDGNAP